MVTGHTMYRVAPWVLYQSKDPLRAVHGRAGIDAVIVESPYERVRYEAYLTALQGDKVTPSDVRRMRAQAASQIGFLVYAHSRTDMERAFLAQYRPATIALANGRVVRDDAIVRFGPSDDFYDVGSFREERWAGSITYRFPIASCSESGVLRLRDGYGRLYAFPFDLRKYR